MKNTCSVPLDAMARASHSAPDKGFESADWSLIFKIRSCFGLASIRLHEVRAPTTEQLHDLLQHIITRIMKWLSCQGYLVEEEGMRYLGEIDAHRALTPLQVASCTYRIAA